MQCIVARLYVKPDCCEEYEAEFAKGAKIVHDNEEGCLLYQLAKDRKEKGKYYYEFKITQTQSRYNLGGWF